MGELAVTERSTKESRNVSSTSGTCTSQKTAHEILTIGTCESEELSESRQAQLYAMRTETRCALEQSWKEVESMKRECLSKIVSICRLQSKIGASNVRKCAAIERVARIRWGHSSRSVVKLKCYHSEPSAKEKESGTREDEGGESSCMNIVSFLRRKKEDLKIDTMRADNQLRLSSRDKVIAVMEQGLRESRQTLQRLRERRWAALTKELCTTYH
jgi:hypothetical protein